MSVIQHLGKEITFYISSITPRLLNTWAVNQNKPQIYQLACMKALIEYAGTFYFFRNSKLHTNELFPSKIIEDIVSKTFSLQSDDSFILFSETF